jgi:PAS domain S-box-containing protein
LREPIDWLAALDRNRSGAWLRASLLIGFCLVIVAASLDAAHRERQLGDRLLRQHRVWSDRHTRYERFAQHAQALSAPCNEVFDSGNLEAETARTRLARVAFDADLDSARFEVTMARSAATLPILDDLQLVETETNSLMTDVDRTFRGYEAGSPPDVSVINDHLNRIDDAVANLASHAREAEGREARTLLDAAAFMQRVTSAVLVVFSLALAFIGFVPRRRAVLATGAETPAAAPPMPVSTPANEGFVRPATFEAAPDPVIALDDRGWITGWNDHAERVFGRSSVDYHGLAFTEAIVAAQDRSKLDEAIADFAASGDPEILNRRFDVTGLDHQGRQFPIEVALVPVRADGTLGFNAFVRDVTLRRRADDDLRRLSAITGKITSGALVTDAAGRIEWANEAFARLTGLALESVAGLTLDAVLAETRGDAASIEGALEAIRAGRVFRVEVATGPSQDPRWIEFEGAPGFDDAGKITQFVVTATDVSSRKSAEASLRDAEARSRAVFDEMADGLLTIDEAGLITLANPAAERMFESPLMKLVGQDVRTLLPCIEPGTASNGARSEAGAWSVPTQTPWGLRRNGTHFPIEITICRAHFGSHRWMCVVRDIEPAKRSEALHAAQNRALALMSSGAPLDSALKELIRLVEQQRTGALCMIAIQDPGQTRPRVVASAQLASDFARAVEAVEIGPSAGTWGAASTAKARIIIDNTATHPAWTGFRQLALDHGLRSSWAEPLLSATGHRLGAFTVFRRRTHTPDAAELELVASTARIAAIAIERSCSMEELGAYLLDEALARAA